MCRRVSEEGPLKAPDWCTKKYPSPPITEAKRTKRGKHGDTLVYIKRKQRTILSRRRPGIGDR